MNSKVTSDVWERDIEITDGPDVPLGTSPSPSQRKKIRAQWMSVRYLNLGVGLEEGHWMITSIDVYGQRRSLVNGDLTSVVSKVCYDSPERDCPKELLDEAVKHSPGRVWSVTK